jgi:hypothetical protein
VLIKTQGFCRCNYVNEVGWWPVLTGDSKVDLLHSSQAGGRESRQNRPKILSEKCVRFYISQRATSGPIQEEGDINDFSSGVALLNPCSGVTEPFYTDKSE